MGGISQLLKSSVKDGIFSAS